MLKKIRIRNFKSIEDITLELDEVNLLIGPNNSGKSNILKALEFFSNCYYGKDIFFSNFDDLNNRNSKEATKEIAMIFENGGNFLHCYYRLFSLTQDKKRIRYTFISWINNEKNFIDWNEAIDLQKIIFKKTGSIKYCLSDYTEVKNNFPFINEINNGIGYQDLPGVTIIPSKNPDYNLAKSKYVYPHPSLLEVNFFKEIHEYFNNIKIYRPDTNQIKRNQRWTVNDNNLQWDSSNLASYFDYLQKNEPDIRELIEKDLQKFLKDFRRILVQTVELSEENKKWPYNFIGLQNTKGQKFYSDELSDGSLYFLSLLCIVHQPNPPKLLLLEEPESFIHPRRITEVIDLLIELANDKGIQVIMTTHSPLVVDEFSDIPEAVHVVEMENGITKVKNLKKDIIDVTNKKIKKKGWEPIDYSKSLGENWIIGLLGGMPND